MDREWTANDPNSTHKGQHVQGGKKSEVNVNVATHTSVHKLLTVFLQGMSYFLPFTTQNEQTINEPILSNFNTSCGLTFF